MSKLEPNTDTKDVPTILADFMESIEGWQSNIEGSPNQDDMIELNKIYDITEVELRFTINTQNANAEHDITEATS